MTTQPSDQEKQVEYYTQHAATYGSSHEGPDSAHDVSLAALLTLLPGIQAESLLDVGTGTGRALRFLAARSPGLRLKGIEPVPALIREAEGRGVPPGSIQVGSGTALPFADGAFDVVTSFGVLHHVARPAEMIAEMLRVAQKAVFISDSNRFAQGRPVARYLKLALHAAGLWPLVDWVRTAGKGYMESEGDGVFYSYSVFDSMKQLRAGSKRLLLLETECSSPAHGLWSSPLANASTLLVGAYK